MNPWRWLKNKFYWYPVQCYITLVGLVVLFCVAVGAYDSMKPGPPLERTGYRFSYVFDNGVTLYSNMPSEFSYLDTMTCVYNYVEQDGREHSRKCFPADIGVLVHDKNVGPDGENR